MRQWWSQRENCTDGLSFSRACVNWSLLNKWKHRSLKKLIRKPTWVGHLWLNRGLLQGKALLLSFGTFWSWVCEGGYSDPCPGQGTDPALLRVTDFALTCVTSPGWNAAVKDLLKFYLGRCFLCSRKIPAVFFQCPANEGESVFYLCYHGKLTTIQAVIYR